MKKSNEPKTEPCGIPVKISLVVEVSFAITTNCFLSFKYNMKVFYNASNTIMLKSP